MGKFCGNHPKRRGNLDTPHWEKWFPKEDLIKLLRRHCRQVEARPVSYWEDVEPDGLFLAWLAEGGHRTLARRAKSAVAGIWRWLLRAFVVAQAKARAWLGRAYRKARSAIGKAVRFVGRG